MSYLAYFPNQDVTIVVLSNASPGAPGTSPMVLWRTLADLFLWEELDQRPSFRRGKELDKEALEKYVGTYDFQLLGTLRVRVEDGKLFAQLSAQSEVPLEPQGGNTFYYSDGGAEFSFNLNDKDEVRGVTLVQAGFRIEAEQYDEPEIIELDADDLRQYVGDYDFRSAVMQIRVGKDGNLTAKLGAQPVLTIYPSARNAFFWKIVRANIEFKFDPETGEVTGLEHHQNGKTINALRMKKVSPEGLAPSGF